MLLIFVPIVWQNITTGERGIWLMNGTTKTGDASLGTVPTEWSIAGTGDFNGDGKGDFLFSTGTCVYKAHGPSTCHLQLLTLLSNGFGALATAGTSIGTDFAAALGDWNGDGKDTLGFYNAATHQLLTSDSLSTGAVDHVFAIEGTSTTSRPIVVRSRSP